MPRVAVVLFNLGGPDGPEAIRPFLRNLFGDPAILRMPAPLRWVLSRVIARRRTPAATEIYARMGGKSPILAGTRDQAEALAAALGDGETSVFIAMRHWHPMSRETVSRVREFNPDRVVLLPLYPQFSTSTTGSSVRDWQMACRRAGLDAPVSLVCCYPDVDGFVAAIAGHVGDALARIGETGRVRVVFSAHGLPESFVARGDPYQFQIERTVAAIVDRLGLDGLDHVIAYQSRVGPQSWIGPYTDDEIVRAGRDGLSVVVAPVAFVSEHSETLVELDIEYAALAERSGVPRYVRVPTVATTPAFIDALAGLAGAAIAAGDSVRSQGGGRICPARFGACPHPGRPVCEGA